MNWAARRRLFILLVIGALVIAFVFVVSIATVYEAPSCTDGVQNQDEAGIDCGGACAYLCVASLQSPTVLFTQAFTDTSTGRTVVVASIENKNATAAARNVPYRVTVYGAKQTLIQSIPGTIDLPPGATATVFISGIASGAQVVTNAFLDMDASSIKWFTMTSDPRIVPGVSNTIQGGSVTMPRVDATLVNSSVSTLKNVQVVVLVRDARANVIAASGTVIPLLGAQSTATATFTWNTPFPGIPASIQVVPVIPLP